MRSPLPRLRPLSRSRHLAAAVACACALWVAAASAAAGKGSLLVLNKADSTLVIVDPDALRVLATVPTGEGPHEVATSADGKLAFVMNYGGAQVPGRSISIIDVPGRKELERVDLGALRRPHGAVVQDGKLWFTVELNRAVARLDPATRQVDWLMGTGQPIGHMLAVAPGGQKLYVANLLGDSVSAVSAGKFPGGWKVEQVAVGKQPEAIDLSPDGKEVWVGNRGEDTISVIDTATDQVKETLREAGHVPFRIKFTPDGKRVLVSMAESREVAVYDAKTRKILKRIALGGVTMGLVVTPDSRRAFVATDDGGKVYALDLQKLAAAGSVVAGQGPDGLAWAAGS